MPVLNFSTFLPADSSTAHFSSFICQSNHSLETFQSTDAYDALDCPIPLTESPTLAHPVLRESPRWLAAISGRFESVTLLLCLSAHPNPSAAQDRLPCVLTACARRRVAPWCCKCVCNCVQLYVNLYVMRVYLHGIDLRTERRDGVHCILDELPIEMIDQYGL